MTDFLTQYNMGVSLCSIKQLIEDFKEWNIYIHHTTNDSIILKKHHHKGKLIYKIYPHYAKVYYQYNKRYFIDNSFLYVQDLYGQLEWFAKQ